MNLSEQFIQHLEQDQIFEFTTREALDWYNTRKIPGSKHANHSDLNFLIIKPLILQKKIRRVYTGNYQVINRVASTPIALESFKVEPKTIESKPEESQPMSQEEKEFFDYIASKIKGGETR